ncbi:MAG: helix-turn-helix domain-containing protein, partial [Acinetobacter sp.]
TLRKAAQTWGLPYSTINNYFEKNTMPGLNVVATIAKVENVPLEWLVYGDGEPSAPRQMLVQSQSKPASGDNDLVNEFLKRASDDDREKLINTLCEIGIKGILNKLQQADKPPTELYTQTRREGVPTTEELEEMIMALPVRESLKTAFSRGITAGEAADKEILRILESYQRGVLPEGDTDSTATPDSSLNTKAG